METLTNNKSAWEEGLSVIDSVLEPGSATEAVLTDEQRNGLKNLRRRLLCPGGRCSESHIPKSLLLSSRKRNKMCEESRGEEKLSSEDEATNFLLSSFAGIGGKDRTRKKFKLLVNAQTFLGRLKSLSPVNNTDDDDDVKSDKLSSFLPPGYLDLSPTTQQRLSTMLSWESLSQWDFNIFEFKELCPENPLVYVGWAILGSPYAQYAMETHLAGDNATDSPKPLAGRPGYCFLEKHKITGPTLIGFLRVIQDQYMDVPYHNQYHASDVLQSLHSLLQMNDSVNRLVHDEIEVFAILITAVIHDIGHPGYNNAFQVNSRSDLALQYNDKSVLENMHASKAFELLMGRKRKPEWDILSGFSNDQASAIRNMAITFVLQTDMTKHFEKVNQIKGLLLEKQDSNNGNNNAEEDPPESLKGDSILGFLLHTADISNSAKKGPMFEQWADRCLEEFFRQGDRERELRLPISPLCDRKTTKRSDSQIGFISYIILPTFELLGKLIPDVATHVVPIIHNNLAFWKEQKTLEDKGNSKENACQNEGKGLPNKKPKRS